MATLPYVPAPKNSGRALLADTANEEQGTYHYPVRRRGLPRALLPNWDAIAWLEADEAATEIEYEENSEADGLVYTFAVGRAAKSYPRPMFQVINDKAFSSFRGLSGTACPCGDFSRSMYCPDCQELEYDWNRRAWIRPGTSIWYEHHPEDRPTPAPEPTVYADTGARPLYDRMIEMFGQPLPPYAEQASLRGQWVETSQFRNFGVSRCPCSHCTAGRQALVSNLEISAPTPDRVPDSLGPTREEFRATIRIEGVFNEGTVTYEEDTGDRPA